MGKNGVGGELMPVLLAADGGDVPPPPQRALAPPRCPAGKNSSTQVEASCIGGEVNLVLSFLSGF